MDYEREQRHFDKIRWIEKNHQRQVDLLKVPYKDQNHPELRLALAELSKVTARRIRRLKFWHNWGQTIMALLIIIAIIVLMVILLPQYQDVRNGH